MPKMRSQFLTCFRCNGRFYPDERSKLLYEQTGNPTDLPYICQLCKEYNRCLHLQLPLPEPGPIKELLQLEIDEPLKSYQAQPTLFDLQ